jgi:DnaK suppressor protein
MRTIRQIPRTLLGREEHEVRRQVSDLLRIQPLPVGIPDVPEQRRIGRFDAAIAEVTEFHREVLRQRLAARSEALMAVQEHIRDGTYGICECCGARIPRRRLQAMPTATLCIACQKQQEAAAA